MEIKEYIDPEQFKQDVEYNPLQIDKAVDEQAGLTAHYGTQYALAKRQAANAKLAQKVIEAKVNKRIREEAQASKTKITEGGIAAAVQTDPSVVKAQRDRIDAEYYENLGESATEAFRHRRDMLKERGMSARSEIFSDPKVSSADTAVVPFKATI